MNQFLNSILMSANNNGGSSGWVWVWLSNEIGQDAAIAVQSILMILVYGTAIWICVVQGFRIAGYMHEKNSKDLKIRQDAREGVRAGIIIIAVTALMAGVGMSAIFFFLNKFLGA